MKISVLQCYLDTKPKISIHGSMLGISLCMVYVSIDISPPLGDRGLQPCDLSIYTQVLSFTRLQERKDAAVETALREREDLILNPSSATSSLTAV